MPATGEQVELRHGDQRAVVVEVGGALRRYAVGDRDVLDGFDEGEMSTAARGQVLVPWPNRLRDGRYEFAGEHHQLPLTEPEHGNAIHGLARWVNWTVDRHDDARVRLTYVLHPREGYPFALSLAVDYALDDGGLTVRTTATNVGERSCPYGAGAHPYVTAGTDTIDPCTLRAPGGRWMPTDDRWIPIASEPVDATDYDFRIARRIGSTQLDTGFGELERGDDGLARVQLVAPDGESSVTVWQDESYPYLMLFTGDSVPEPGRRRRGLGVEPMTCAPNALQSGEGLAVLQPGATFTGLWGIAPG